ncbi:MAG: metallo-beta-lactamase family protein [Gammaproteobacteria bacterium]|jgi:metallo-beta-lactamase family protein
MQIEFHGGAGEVTGSCYLVEVNGRRILLDCGMIQGRAKDERRNREPFAFDPTSVDAMILSHAHIDHSGRIPLLVKSGFKGSIYTHLATRDLCRIMLKDSAYLSERDASWENRKRERKHLPLVEPLYTVAEAQFALTRFKAIRYAVTRKLFPGVTMRLSDAGHILGAAIVELWLEEKGIRRKLVFSGDLGHNGAPILRDVTEIEEADLVLMESTYGDRLHRTLEDTKRELVAIQDAATRARGNILIPAFAVGRTQELLYLFAKYFTDWGLSRWQIFLDSPMAIQATEVYARHSDLYDQEAAQLWRQQQIRSLIPNLHLTRTANQSMALNRIRSGAIIVAGSGMCTGGRIKHHLKHNIWRKNCHVIISGFQAQGTLGRQLVDGARRIRLWGETIQVAASIHTVGGLSAHADQDGLVGWYQNFKTKPPLVLVHGEAQAAETLRARIRDELQAPVQIAQAGDVINLSTMEGFTKDEQRRERQRN